MDPLYLAQPGEWYRVTMEEGDWALAYWDGDPPDRLVWIQVGPGVQLLSA
jgi:hypothetical protein